VLVVRFRETFRERMPEWALATGMVGWGLLTLASSHLFSQQPYFFPLLAIMRQDAWGTLVLGIGIVRLLFLVINGAWRPSAHIRAVGCALGTMLWASLFIAALNLTWLSPTTAIYAVLLALDMISLWFAAGDAKLADMSAKGKLRKV
jgi:hypothetical protein